MILSFPCALAELSLALDNSGGGWDVVSWECAPAFDASAHEALEHKIQAGTFPDEVLAFVSAEIPAGGLPDGTTLFLGVGPSPEGIDGAFSILCGFSNHSAWETIRGGRDGDDPACFEAMVRSVGQVARALAAMGLDFQEEANSGWWLSEFEFDAEGGWTAPFRASAQTYRPEDAGRILAAKAAVIFAALSGTSDLRRLRVSGSSDFPWSCGGEPKRGRGVVLDSFHAGMERLASRIEGEDRGGSGAARRALSKLAGFFRPRRQEAA